MWLRDQRAVPGGRRRGTHRAGADLVHRRDARRRPSYRGARSPGSHRGRHVAPAAACGSGGGFPCGKRPGLLPVHENDHTGGAAALPARGHRRGARGTAGRRTGPGRGAAHDRYRPAGRRRMTADALGPAEAALAPADALGPAEAALAPADALGPAEAALAPADALGPAEAALAPADVLGPAEAALAPADVLGPAEAALAPADVLGPAEAALAPADVL